MERSLIKCLKNNEISFKILNYKKVKFQVLFFNYFKINQSIYKLLLIDLNIKLILSEIVIFKPLKNALIYFQFRTIN